MNKKDLISALMKFDSDNVIVFNRTTGQYQAIKYVARGMGYGILLEVE